MEGPGLTSCLDAKVDLALGRMGDGVPTELHIRADKGKQEGQGETKYCSECFA